MFQLVLMAGFVGATTMTMAPIPRPYATIESCDRRGKEWSRGAKPLPDVWRWWECVGLDDEATPIKPEAEPVPVPSAAPAPTSVVPTPSEPPSVAAPVEPAVSTPVEPRRRSLWPR